MPPPSKKKRHYMGKGENARAHKEEQEKRRKRLQEREEEAGVFYQMCDDHGIANERGRSRTAGENRIVLLLMRVCMQLWISLMAASVWDPMAWNWKEFDQKISQAIHMKQEHVRQLRTHFKDTGQVLVFGEEFGEGSRRGGAAEAYQHKYLLSQAQVLWLVNHIDDEHAASRTVNNTQLRSAIFRQFNIELSRMTMSNYMKRMGLSWKKAKGPQRVFADYRKDAIRTYLLELAKFRKMEARDEIVFIYLDESYVHQTHCMENSYVHANTVIKKSAGKGRRIVILHAISKYGPLCERIDGIPIDDLTWNGDTPHPEAREDGLQTCETLWLANSSSGDYHDNMNSEMFYLWCETRLIPVAEKLYPDKKIVVVADNAAYHHKRQIGSLGGKKKQELIDLCIEHNIQYLDLPPNEHRYRRYQDDLLEHVQDCGAYYRVEFDPVEFAKTARASQPFIPSVSEFSIAIVEYMRDNLPHLLECKVERLLKERGHHILWTPPYCPQLQPIELFWAAGKNHVAWNHYGGRTMKKTIEHLRHGWYGNQHLFDVENINPDSKIPATILNEDGSTMRFKKPVNCSKLVDVAIRFVNDKFIPICDGLSGTIDNFVVEGGYEVTTEGMPIDLLMVDLSRGETADEAIEIDEIDTL